MKRARAIVTFLTRRRRALTALGVLVALWIAWRGFRHACGSPADALADDGWTQGTRVLARDGRLLGERASSAGLRGRPVPLEDVSPRLVDATLVSEDHSFQVHDGIDRSALLRALITNVRKGRIVSGGSTITQQLVKRLDHKGRPRPRTLREKLVEAARAQNLERDVDKRTILAAYLARLEYGRGYAGPEAAAQGFFGVRARDLSLAQAALLAVLPRAPSALDPYRHRERAVMRQRALLERMYETNVISREDLDRALGEPVVLRDRTAPGPMLAPHVVLAAGRRRELEVHTTLDHDLQRDVEAITRAHAPRLRARNAANVAVVVVDVASGDVLARVGSADVMDRSNAGAVDATLARRQPGSTLKPFVYARAFEKGLSPTAMLPDVPTETSRGPRSYAPENFDGTWTGPISAREALAGSLNVPAVRLARDLGADDVLRVLRAAGLRLPGNANRYGLSVALGSAEVTPLELAEAYATLARGGEHMGLRTRVGDEPGRTTPVLAPFAVLSVTEALSDPLARIRGLRARGPFELPFPVAVKTGTSSGYRDAWTAGYTRERVVVVWTGNADGAPTDQLSGGMGAGPLFTDVMTRAMRDVRSRAPLVDEAAFEHVEVCPLSGLRPSAACTDHVPRRFPKGHAPAEGCNVHVHASRRPAPPSEPAYTCDAVGRERIVVLPPAFDAWLATQPLGAPSRDPHGTPWFAASQVPGCANAPATAGPPSIAIVSPRDGTSLVAGERGVDAVDVEATAFGLPPSTRLEVVVDGRVVSTLDASRRARVPVSRGDHLVEVRPADGRIEARLGRAAIRVR